MQAVPRPETPDPGSVGGALNTADGTSALGAVVSGTANSAFGWFALGTDIAGSFNTALGAGTLVLNQADSNTAVGTAALLFNNFGSGPNTGTQNTAVGTAALELNSGGDDDSEGSFNDAVGAFALTSNTTGFSNNAFGDSALLSNTTGAANTAVGDASSSGGAGDEFSFNTVVGYFALFSGVEIDPDHVANSNNAVGALALAGVGPTPPPNTGVANNAFGVSALEAIETGSANVAVGDSAGSAIVDGSFNIYIGDGVGASVDPSEHDTIRIGDTLDVACYIGGIAGVPVTGDPVVVDGATGQLGIAGPSSPLSANKLLKQQHLVQELKATTERQAAVIALQEGQIKALTAGLKQQAEQIQKVSAQLEMIRPTPRVVENR